MIIIIYIYIYIYIYHYHVIKVDSVDEEDKNEDGVYMGLPLHIHYNLLLYFGGVLSSYPELR